MTSKGIGDRIAEINGRLARVVTDAVQVQEGQLRRSVRTGLMRDSVTGEHYIQVNPVRQPVEYGRSNGTNVFDRRPIERARAQACGQTPPFLGVTVAEAATNLKIALGHCPHGLAEEVRLITGEVVAAVCPTCLDVLPPSFVGSDWKP